MGVDEDGVEEVLVPTASVVGVDTITAMEVVVVVAAGEALDLVA